MTAVAPAGKIRLSMSMSLDGFIAGPDHGLGVDGERLHAWLHDGGVDPGSHRPAGGGPDAVVFQEMMATGAVITGRRTFQPIPDEPAPGHARYETDVVSAVAQAKEAAGGRDVLLHGAAAAQACLRAGALDELELHLVPVLLGQGRRLFEGLPTEPVELGLVRSLEGVDVLHLRYRVLADVPAGG